MNELGRIKDKAPTNALRAIGVEVESEASIFFDESALREVGYTLYRMDSSGLRWYYTLNEDNEPTFFISVTSKNQLVIPKGYGFHQWLKNNSAEESDYIRDSRSAYGTMMHIEFGRLLLNRRYDFENLREMVFNTAQIEGFYELRNEWHSELVKDMLAFGTFLQENRVKPLAIELMLKSEKHGYAGGIDLVCEMDVEVKGFHGEVYKSGKRKGEPKETKEIQRKICIVDYKSSKKGNYYEEHEVQLEDYREMWNENFPEMQAEMIFNYSGNDWRTSPSYKLFDQTGKTSRKKAELYIQMYKLKREEDNLSPKDVLSVGGIMDLEGNISDCYKIQSATDFVHEEKQREEKGIMPTHSKVDEEKDGNI